MRDRVSTKILDNGATRYGIYDEAGNLLRYEYIKLEDLPTVPGSLWNKANVLPDDIPAALGLGMSDPQVKDVLGVVADIGNVRVWSRTITYSNAGYTLGESSAYEVSRFSPGQTPTTGMSVQYASNVIVSSDGTVSLVNPSTLDFVGYADDIPGLAVLAGKFCSFTKVSTLISYETQVPAGIVYIPSDATFSDTSDGSDVVITCSKIQIVMGYGAGKNTDYVVSTDSTAYPQDGDVGDYHYTYQGKLGDKARIEVGSYVGTGTYGSGNKNTLAFKNKSPKKVTIVPKIHSNNSQIVSGSFPFVNRATSAVTRLSLGSYSTNSVNLSWSDDSVSWYSSVSADIQLNANSATYFYVAEF